MAERAYTYDEIERMRESYRTIVGAVQWSPSRSIAEINAEAEDSLRTAMQAGVDPAEVYKASNAVWESRLISAARAVLKP
jgi:hypothetical protein